MFDAMTKLFGVRAPWACETEPDMAPEEEEGGSINDPNPSGNPDEDNG